MEGFVDSKKIERMVLNLFVLFTEPVTEPSVLLHGPVAECLRLAVGPAQKMFLNEKGACQNDMKTISLQFYGFAQWTGTECFVLLTGPVSDCLRLVHGKELPAPKGWNSLLPRWEPQVTIARNCRFQEVGTHGSQPGNQRLYQCNQLPVPTWEPQVTMARTCRLPDLETYGSQPGNQRLPLQGIAGSQKLEFMFSKLSGFHSKELPVGSKPEKVTLPVEGSVGCEKLNSWFLMLFCFVYWADNRTYCCD